MAFRKERVAERIRTVLSEMLLREVNDPRLQGVTVTEVKVDREMNFADIYVNALGEEERAPDILDGLQSASGFLRRAVGNAIDTRNTPELHFHWDATLAYGERLNEIIDNLDIPEAAPVEIEDEEDDWA